MDTEEELKEGMEEGEEMPNLDDAFEADDALAGEDDLGHVEDIDEDEEGYDNEFFTDEKDGNY